MEPARESAIFGHFACLCFFEPANSVASLLPFLIGPLLIHLLSQKGHQITAVMQVVIKRSCLHSIDVKECSGLMMDIMH